MNVTFEPAARDELDRIFAWIAKNNPRAAIEVMSRIEEKVMRLAIPELTHMGRPGLVEGTRELIEWPYIVVYKVHEDRGEASSQWSTARETARQGKISYKGGLAEGVTRRFRRMADYAALIRPASYELSLQ